MLPAFFYAVFHWRCISAHNLSLCFVKILSSLPLNRLDGRLSRILRCGIFPTILVNTILLQDVFERPEMLSSSMTQRNIVADSSYITTAMCKVFFWMIPVLRSSIFSVARIFWNNLLEQNGAKKLLSAQRSHCWI